MTTLTYIKWSVLLLASTASVAQLKQSNKKWLDSIYEVNNTPLKRGNKYVTKKNDTIKLLRPINNIFWKVKKGRKKMIFPRDTIFYFRRVKDTTTIQ